MGELRKILHVEDDPDISEIVKLCLEVLGGFELLQCASGAEALNVAEGFAPDLFFLDMMMPGMNGLETLQALRSLDTLKDVPAIFVTSVNTAEQYHDAILEQSIGSIPKPFDPSLLAEQVLEYWSKYSK